MNTKKCTAWIRIQKNARKIEITSSTHLCIVPSISSCPQASSTIGTSSKSRRRYRNRVRMWLVFVFCYAQTRIRKIEILLSTHHPSPLFYLLSSQPFLDTPSYSPVRTYTGYHNSEAEGRIAAKIVPFPQFQLIEWKKEIIIPTTPPLNLLKGQKKNKRTTQQSNGGA